MVKRKKAKSLGPLRDPYRNREARKYANPIPSREYILGVLEDHAAPLRFEKLAEQLRLTGDQQQIALKRRLNAMERDGQVLRNRKAGYCVVNTEDLVAGRVIGHPDGFGFLKPDEGGDDLFLSPRQMKRLWHGDRVVVRVVGIDQRGRREGAAVEILERGVTQLVGRLHIEAGVGFVVPDNKRQTHEVLIPSEALADAADRQIVLVELTEQPEDWKQPMGRVIEVLGDHLAPGMETEIALRAHELPIVWPAEVTAAVAGLGTSVGEEDKNNRLDLRHLPLVTIDGADARDFDDAVYCEPTAKGWRLLVCIADVSTYVKPGTPLDAEAYKRGNSVYFPDRVIPMLPEVLSNGLCSLNPQVDRLCMSVDLYFDRAGRLYRSRFTEAVMRSHARLTYDEVDAMLRESDAELRRIYADLLIHLDNLQQLFQLLRRARAKRGAIDFDTVETRFRFDHSGKVVEIVPLERHDAHRIIEECMLAANVAAARLLLRHRVPALYRIHERPSVEKLTELQQFLGQLGLRLEGGTEPTAVDYANLLDAIGTRPDANMIQTVLLRSMMQAVYSAENLGHFGLAFPAYVHFTSPIRRYPDLMVHRAIKHVLAGGVREDFDFSQPQLKTMGEHCSMTERRADDATRDVVDTLKCEFMQDRVGERFWGVINGVNSFGVFVELTDIYVTGLVHVTALDYDYFHFDPIAHRLTGERTGKTYRLGDRLSVQLAAVNLDERKIDFVLAEVAGREQLGKRRVRKKRR